MVVFGSPGMRADRRPPCAPGARVGGAHRRDWIGNIPNVTSSAWDTAPTPPVRASAPASSPPTRADGHAGYLEPGTDSLANFAPSPSRSYHTVHCAARSQQCANGVSS